MNFYIINSSAFIRLLVHIKDALLADHHHFHHNNLIVEIYFFK